MNGYIKSFPKIVESSASNMYARRDLHDGEVVPLPYVVKVNVPNLRSINNTKKASVVFCLLCFSFEGITKIKERLLTFAIFDRNQPKCYLVPDSIKRYIFCCCCDLSM